MRSSIKSVPGTDKKRIQLTPYTAPKLAKKINTNSAIREISHGFRGHRPQSAGHVSQVSMSVGSVTSQTSSPQTVG